MEIPKTYNPKDYEDKIYKKWEDSGFFNPDNLEGEPFSIMVPPPNVTGVLHLGHAYEDTLMDIMVRYQRLKGKKVLLQPGTDHAAVATQAKVERVLMEEEGYKNPREELGREKLLEKIREYSENSKATILNQMKKMGLSADWSRLAYTFDEQRGKAVNTVFKKMYEDGLIYRGYRVVNWSVKGQSTCSDDEVEHVDRQAKLYTFKYSEDFPFTIATTRPETKLGDTAVAVNPNDKRYKKYIGKEYDVDFCGNQLKLKIIANDEVDPKFGTGAVGVTPAHSPVDYEMYLLQQTKDDPIRLIPVIDKNGKMTPQAGKEFAGLTVDQAREKVIEKLKKEKLFIKEEEITQSVGTSDRFKDVVEALPMTQWFVDVNKKIALKDKSLKELMKEAVEIGHNGDKDKKIEIIPNRFEKVYYKWIDNLRPWCISRQVWWGHQIPVWYKKFDKPIELTFIRHRQSAYNAKDLAAGWEDCPLSDKGKEQTKELVEKLKGRKYDAIFCSDLIRTKETAKAIFPNEEIVYDKRLREINFGDLTGKINKEVNKYRETGFPNGETYQDLRERLNDFILDKLDKYQGKKVAIVTHSGMWKILENIVNDRLLNSDLLNQHATLDPVDYKITSVKKFSDKKIGSDWIQDPDTLDTWFSSGLWTFSTLGWPDQTKELETFHPTNWMQMGHEILFFWMARMILMTTYNLDTIPFKQCYIHGILRDEKNQKFSKTLGNGIDPIDMIDKYGADALRWSLMVGTSAGNDSKFYEDKVETGRNMVNKLWNISRYIIENPKSETLNSKQFKNSNELNPKTLADRALLEKLDFLIESVTGLMDKYEFAQAGELIREFVWGEFADWYLEIAKIEEEKGEEKDLILRYVLANILKLWHPFIPFVTEAVWGNMGNDKDLIVSSWPEIGESHKDAEIEYDKLKDVIVAIRNLRTENKIEPAKKINVSIINENETIKQNLHLIRSLAKAENVEFVNKKPEQSVGTVVNGVEIYILLTGLVDLDKEKERITKEIEALKAYLNGLDKKLNNSEFVSNAPKEIVDLEKEKQAQAEDKLQKLSAQLEQLK
jgi:valyl-tRNA synthetase